MNPSILLVDPLTWVGTYSFPNLRRWFGGEPIGQPTPIPIPTPTGVTTITGTLTVMRDGVSLGNFVVSPKPSV